MYYNTNNETGIDLATSSHNAKTQNELILYIFTTWRITDDLTPSEVSEILRNSYNKIWPLTSVRRAISTLTNQGKLTKTNKLREGRYGKNTHAWKHNTIQSITQIRNDLNDTDTPGQGSNGF